jgi:phenylacetate-CoA ligase
VRHAISLAVAALTAPFILLRSALPGAEWPAVVRPEHATYLALQYQLERSQWLPAGELEALQYRQLDSVARHAFETAPFYRWHWGSAYEPGKPLDPERLARLPLLKRSHLQESFDELRSTRLPAAHGQVGESRTSGSTGTLVRVLKSELLEMWWRALTLREHLWQRRDFTGKLAGIRMGLEDGEGEGWGPATEPIAVSGRSAGLSIRADVATQLEWLLRQQPDYLLTYPSNAHELARLSLERGIRLARLREVRTIGEVLFQETRELIREAWNAPVVDVYSTEECGQIAIQCPSHLHYHVQSESVLVEVLDEQGRACAPGAIGRVVVTALQNLSMPLVRYDLGDFAEVGAPCPCGRGLPVLNRIVGRVRNMLRLATGERYWPVFGARRMLEIAPVKQHQFVQKSFDTIEVRLVTAGPLAAAQEEQLRSHMRQWLPDAARGLRLVFSYPKSIPRGAGGKFEDFISEVAS